MQVFLCNRHGSNIALQQRMMLLALGFGWSQVLFRTIKLACLLLYWHLHDVKCLRCERLHLTRADVLEIAIGSVVLVA
jgi:hypothetical protein